MFKKQKITILVFFSIFILGLVFLKLNIKQENLTDWVPSERAEKFYISSGKTFPVFTKEVIADPFKVKEGEKQTFSIWVKDPQGIKEVRANIDPDAEEELIELELVEGTDQEGRWVGFWITRNISAQSTYSTNFLAINKEGKDTKMTLFWEVEE
jgi:hypothetical protein